MSICTVSYTSSSSGMDPTQGHGCWRESCQRTTYSVYVSTILCQMMMGPRRTLVLV